RDQVDVRPLRDERVQPRVRDPVQPRPDHARELDHDAAVLAEQAVERGQTAQIAGKQGYVVRIINTEQGAWWETLLGTEPSRNRFATVMPLLPTTIRSEPRSSATSRMASAGSPWRAKVSTSTPASRVSRAASSSVPSTSSRGLTAHSTSLGASRDSERRRSPETGSYADTMSSDAPTCFARSMAWRTASLAVADPSPPTTLKPTIPLP